MNNNKQYVIIGAFVIFSLAAMIIIGIWLAFGLDDTKYNTYLAVFNEPVDGLQLNSDVKFNGVSVGKVSAININKKNPSNVDVELAIQDGTPITTSTYATLMAQGITGLSYIGLQTKYRKPPIQLLTPTSSPPYTEIVTKPSILSNITQQIEKVSNDVGDISNSVAKMVNNENSLKVNDIITNVDDITKTIANNDKNIQQSFDNLNKILANISDSSNQFNDMITNINQTAKSVAIVGEQVAEIAKSVQFQTLQGLNQVVIPELATSIRDINESAIQLNQLLDALNRNPSMLVTGQLPPQPGPGE
ncbi:MCE family protein [Francisellaceae bacterium]|nr:MCE family protein [Francisellaceae bacterium]